MNLSKELARSLRNYFDSIDYRGVTLTLRGLGFFVNPWPPFYETRMALHRLPPRLKTVFQLLYLGEEVDYHDAHSAMETSLVKEMAEAGILEFKDSKVRNKGYSFVCFQGLILLASLSPQYPTSNVKSQPLYLGRDSYGLAHFITDLQGEEALDLCAGCGIQSLVLARNFKRVWAVEILPEAVEAIRFNAMLNGLEEKIKHIQGDLYKPVEGKQFDAVVCNPPYLPVPPTVNYPISTNGGEDGLTVMRRVVQGLESHLTPEGIFAAVGEGPGNRSEPLLTNVLRISGGKNISFTVIQASREIIGLMVYILSQAVAQVLDQDEKKLNEIYREHFSMLGSTHYYHYFVKGRRGVGGLELLKLHGDWEPEYVPMVVSKHEFEARDALARTAAMAHLGEEHKRVLSLCDGNRSILQIAEALFPHTARELDKWSRVQRLLNMCDELEGMGFVARSDTQR